MSSPSILPKPGRGWWIAVMLFFLTTINCVDRLVLASVAPILRTDLALTNQQYSYIVIAFMAGMTLGQLPVGSLLDRIGVRLGLPLILCGWSVVNVLHVFARLVIQFSGLRLIMGVFESGNYSGGLKAIGRILPASQRGVALGLFNSGFLLGSVLAPPIVVATTARFGWKAAFVIPGCVGVFWIFPWLWACRGIPALARPVGADASEAASHSITALLRERRTWGVIAVRATTGPVAQFYWYWLPLYLVRGRGATMAQMGSLASFAYVVGAFGNVLGGYVSGRLIRSGMPVATSRRVTFAVGALLSTVGTALAPFAPSILAADLLASVGIFGINVASCMLLAVMSDVFPPAVLARVGGLTGMGDGVVSMVLTLCAGIILDRFSFLHVFVGASLLPVLSIVALWTLVRPTSEPARP